MTRNGVPGLGRGGSASAVSGTAGPTTTWRPRALPPPPVVRSRHTSPTISCCALKTLSEGVRVPTRRQQDVSERRWCDQVSDTTQPVGSARATDQATTLPRALQLQDACVRAQSPHTLKPSPPPCFSARPHTHTRPAPAVLPHWPPPSPPLTHADPPVRDHAPAALRVALEARAVAHLRVHSRPHVR